MSLDLLIRAPVGLLPVLIFLVALLYLDSYKLVNFRTILVVILAGALVTFISYFANGAARDLMGIQLLGRGKIPREHYRGPRHFTAP